LIVPSIDYWNGLQYPHPEPDEAVERPPLSNKRRYTRGKPVKVEKKKKKKKEREKPAQVKTREKTEKKKKEEEKEVVLPRVLPGRACKVGKKYRG
jgi:hypothetical protein